MSEIRARKSSIPVVNYTICPNCGERMPDDSFGCPPNFCPSCGMRTGALLANDEDTEELDFDERRSQSLEDMHLAMDYE